MLNSARRRQRPGRPPGVSDRREAILRSALTLFAERGFAGASLRRVAAHARVDPALIVHYFGSKQGLFEATLRPPIDAGQLALLFRGPRSSLGRRVARFYVDTVFRAHAETAASLLRSALSDARAAALLSAAIQRGPAEALAGSLRGPDAVLRGELVASHMIGLFFARHLLRIEPLASLPDRRLVDVISPALQRYLTGPLAGGRR